MTEAPSSSAPPRATGIAASLRRARPGAVGRVARNALWLLLSQGGTRILSFLLGTVLARALGVAGFGAYMFVLTYVSYFGFLADAGLGRLLIRDLARMRSEEAAAPPHSPFLTPHSYLEQVTALRLALALAAYALMLVVAMLTRAPSRQVAQIAIVGISLFTGAVGGALASMFNAREEMRVTAIFGLLSSGGTAAFVLVALARGAGLGGVFVAVALANLPPLLWLLLMWRRRGQGLRLHVGLRFWGRALGQASPYALLGVVGLVYFRIDALMLAWMQGTEATGIYTAAYRLLDAVTDAPGVIVAAMFPTLARLHHGPRQELRRAYFAVLGVLTLLGLVAMAGTLLLAGPITALLYGEGFARSATVLRLLAPAVFLIFVDTANTMVLYAGDNLKMVLVLSLVTTAGNVLLNLILIPRYSYNGAAVATVLSTVLSLLIFTPTVLRYLNERPHQPVSSS